MLNKTTNLRTLLETGVCDTGATAEIASEVMAQIGDRDLHKTMARAVERAVGDTGATADIVQSALVSMIEHAGTFDWSKGSIVSWGCRIAANAARNWYRASANRDHDSEAIADYEDDDTIALVDTLVAEDGRLTVQRSIERKRLAAAVASLDADQQTFLDAMAGGMGQCDAGALVGWSPATTTRRYKAITATLADKI